MTVALFGGVAAEFGGVEAEFGAAEVNYMSSIKVDFGVPGETTPSPWNNVTDVSEGVKVADLLDDSAANTGASLEFDLGDWSTVTDQSVATSVRDWPTTATTDFINTSNSTDPGRRIILDFSAADPLFIGTELTFYIWGGTTATGTGRDGTFTIKDSSGVEITSGTHDAASSGIAPPLELTASVPADGILWIDVIKESGDTAAYLSGIEIGYTLSPAGAPTLTRQYRYSHPLTGKKSTNKHTSPLIRTRK